MSFSVSGGITPEVWYGETPKWGFQSSVSLNFPVTDTFTYSFGPTLGVAIGSQAYAWGGKTAYTFKVNDKNSFGFYFEAGVEDDKLNNLVSPFVGTGIALGLFGGLSLNFGIRPYLNPDRDPYDLIGGLTFNFAPKQSAQV